MAKKVLIVGGVAGGAGTAARLRRLDEKAEIILFEQGPYISFANCGLPYYVGDVIEDRNALLLVSPEIMRARFRVDVRVLQEVLSIDRRNKRLRIRKRSTGECYEESYDTLLLATGASPLRPSIPGIDNAGIFQLSTVMDAEHIRDYIEAHDLRHALVVGGGFIGLEAAENLRHRGLSVAIVEALNHVMPPFDYEMALLVQNELRQNGVELCLNESVSAFTRDAEKIRVLCKSGRNLETDMVLLCMGVRPNSELAKAAGLLCNAQGGIVVNDMLRTSDPDIYAVGDVIEARNPISDERRMVSLAGPANKQARIAANNIAGGRERYEGAMGSSIVKVFSLSAACTGENEKSLIRRGLVRGEEYESIIISQNSHAKYYPGAKPMTLKLLFSANGRQLFGAQIVGAQGVDNRINVLATAIRMGATVADLKSLELAYAPPYSSAKDPVNMLGFVAENLLRGMTTFAPWDVMEKEPDALILDVREVPEISAYALPFSVVHIPLGQLRDRLNTLERHSNIIVFCAAGVRAHTAARILMNQGFSRVRIYPGGVAFYRATHVSS